MELEEQKKFFHGTLEITIFDATPFSPTFPFNCICTKPRPAYVTVKLNKKKVAKTSSEHDRVWNQTFQILCAHPVSDTNITITLKTHCSVLGRFRISAEQIITSNTAIVNGCFPLTTNNGSTKPNLKLKCMMWFRPAYLEPGWCKSLEGEPFQGIRNASFPQRSNCKVVLYQDAHHKATFDPRVHDVPCNARNLWEDVYKAIDCARHLVYIAGWALNPNLVLVRDDETEIPHAVGVTIGELLKRKAHEGVAVRVMLWNDESSLPMIKNKGVMRTNDQTALAYFRDTSVVCRLCPRSHKKLPTAFAHHQKTITVDTRVTNTNTKEREIMSFLGGFDLCDGRYDTEEHSLFRTLGTSDDFYQTSLAGAKLSRGGPREPWHDCHVCVVGAAAWDVLKNFEQRWTKQCNPSVLVNTSGIRNLVNRTGPETTEEDDRNWNVQVLRSIDHVSATEMPRGLQVERSVHDGYVAAIRKAERFIYIENQYFMGGCEHWEGKNGSGCTNLIPVEIALKIAAKIRERKRFAVYIVIPMWPEGPPESETVEEMLHWTRETMSMMYKIIGEAIWETVATPERTDAPKDESGKSRVSNGVAQQNDSSVDKQDDANAKDKPQHFDNPGNTDLDNTSEEKPDVEHQPQEKDHSSAIQVDSSKTPDIKEEAEPGALLESKDELSLPPDDSSVEAAISSENDKETSVQALPSRTSADETATVSSPSRAEDLVEESRPKKTANQKKKKSLRKEANQSAASATEEASEEPSTSEAKVTKKSGKKVASSSKTKSTVPQKKSTSEPKAAKQSEKKVVDSDNVQESSKPKEEKEKLGRGKAMGEDSLDTSSPATSSGRKESSGDSEKPAFSSEKSARKSKKEVKQPIEESPNTNTKRKRSLGKERASDLQSHGEDLVGSRVRVWWPIDKEYFKGVVDSYDSAKKKHLVIYDDGDQEILNLKTEKWHFLDESETEGEEAADQTGHEKEASAEPQRKKAKTGKQSKMESSGKKSGGAGPSKSKVALASKSGKKSKDDKTESKPKDLKEASIKVEEDSSEELSEEEETPKTVGKSGTSKGLSKTTTSSKSKSGGPAKCSSVKGKAAKGKANSTPASKSKESDAESESEETPKAPEPATKGKSVGSGKSQAKYGKKRKR